MTHHRRPAMTRLALLMATLAVVLLGTAPGPANAEPPPQASRDEVYRALGLADMATEYVVLVDVSASMASNGRYDSLLAGLRTFVGGLGPKDGFTLITFDATPHVLHHGPVTEVDDELWGMPSVPTGVATDIGAALDEAVKTLEGTPTTTAGAIVLFTDALNEPPPTSRYASAGNEAWQDLARRGGAMDPRVSGYVVPLSSGESGVGELQQTIPDTTVLQLGTAGQVESFLGSLTERVRRSIAITKARAELAAPIEVDWTVGRPGDDLADGVELTVTLRSAMTTMPLEVVAPRLTVAGAAVTITDLPDRRTLAPGKPVHLRVTIRDDEAGGFFYRSTTPRLHARITVELATPWRDVLVDELGLPEAPPPLTGATEWSSTITSGLHPLIVVLPLGALLATIMVLVFRWHRRNPYMRGSLVATTPDGVAVYRDLEGLRADRFPRPRSRENPELRGHFQVRGLRSGGAVLPRVVYHPDAERSFLPRTCVNGYPTEVYGMSMLFTGPHQ